MIVDDAIPAIAEDLSIPEGATCQEASFMSINRYVPCGLRATHVVWHDRDRRGYYMCYGCAYHNVRNRGGRLVAGEEF